MVHGERVELMAHLYFDYGHVGSTGGNPPATHGLQREDCLVVHMGAALYEPLVRANHQVELAGITSYSFRQKNALHVDADLYACLHVNAGWRPGRKDRSVVFYDARRPKAMEVARAICKRLAELTDDAAAIALPAAGYSGPWPLVRTVGEHVPAVVIEPFYIDAPQHRGFCLDPAPIGRAIAAGILDAFPPIQE